MSERVKYVSQTVKMSDSNRCIPSIRLVRGGKARLAEWIVPMRSLPEWHIYWNSTSGGQLILPDAKIVMDPESVYLLPPNLVFATASNGVFEHFFLDFRLEDESFLRVKKEPVRFRRKDYEWILKQCFWQDFSVLTAGTLILALLAAIPPENYVPEGAALMDPRIQRALDLISAAFQLQQLKGLNNRTISRKIGMSQVNFQHLFKRELKISPHRYILNRRLELAHDLLRNSDRSIEDIAEASGFSNRYQFTKSFSGVYKIPPGRFRRK